jgi:tRNA (guanosine-2'-O-)-methyltransferase
MGEVDESLSSRQRIELLSPYITEERKRRIDEVVLGRHAFPLILEDIHNFGNISAVCRTAEALGFYQASLVLPGGSMKNSARTTKGADQWILFETFSTSSDCLDSLRTKSCSLAVTDLEGDCRLDELPLDQPIAIAFGNEKSGVSESLRKAAQFRFRVPMSGFTQSFNISVAAAICLYDIQRRIQKEKPAWTQLSLEAQEDLKAEYYQRSVWFSEPLLRHIKKHVPNWTSL